jgi:hypothetical protein
MVEPKILFCPFCRECFEGERTCPEHDIALVPLERLPPAEHEAESDEDDAPAGPRGDDAPLGLWEPGHGRGLVALGAVLNALSLALVFVRGKAGSDGLAAYELAVTAPSLWTLLLVSFTLLFVLKRRRTARALRGLRVLVPALAFISPLTVTWVLWRLVRGAAVWAPGDRQIGMDLGPSVYVVGVAAVLILVGGLRLGISQEGGKAGRP